MTSRCFRCGSRSASAYCAVCTSGLKQIVGPPSQAVVTRTIADLRAVEEKATNLRFSQGSFRWSNGLGSTEYDYRAAASNPQGNAIVAACVKWACRAFPEAPTMVETKGPKGWAPVEQHPLLGLLDRPNPYYSGLHLWSATLSDFMLSGNAYWVKLRTGVGRPAQLWWFPSTVMEPKWDRETDYISYYEYTVEGQVYRIAPDDVVHFRNGFDPQNIRKGLSDIAALLREIATDNEAANWTASMLRNAGVPSVIVSPEGDYEITQEQAEEAKESYMARTTGDRRGGPLFMSGKTKVSVLSFSPEQMGMDGIRRTPEERISAIFGTPAIVVGLGAGLQRSTFANYAEAREAAYESMIIPTQRLFSAELNGQLVPDFGDPVRLRVGFDLSEVRVLQDDQNALYTRAGGALKDGLFTLNESRELVGKDPLPGSDGDIYYIPSTVTPTLATELIPPKPDPAAVPVPSEPGDQPAAEDAPPDPATSTPAKGLESKAAGGIVLPAGDVEIGYPDAQVALDLMTEIFPQYAGMLNAGLVGSTNGRNGHG